jgi:hypothetical protein
MYKRPDRCYRKCMRLNSLIQGLILFLFSVSASATVYHLPFNDSFDGANNWSPVTSQGSSWQLGTPSFGQTSSPHSAPNAWDVDLAAGYLDSSLAYLVSPVITFAGEYNAELSFWQNRNTEDYFDGFRLEYSKDGVHWSLLGLPNDGNGTNWYTRQTIGSSNMPAWCGSSGGWIRSAYMLIPLNGYSGNVQFRFAFSSSDSIHYDGVSIDDFSVNTAPNKDLAIQAIWHPARFAAISSSDSVSVIVRNTGGHSLNNYTAGYSVNGGPPISQSWNNSLAQAVNDTLNFTVPFVVPSGDFTLCAWVSVAGDGNSSNDSTCTTIKGVARNSIPYQNDFESPVADWFDYSLTGTSWQYGSPSFGLTNSPHSGNFCWDVNLDSAYGNYADANLYSSFFDFSGLLNTRLSFYQNRMTERGFDGMLLEYSTDGGLTWNLLGTGADENSVNWYSSPSIAAFGGRPGWDGGSGGWLLSRFILSDLNNAGPDVQFRFHFMSDGSTNGDGVSIDDLRIDPAPSLDLAVNKIIVASGIQAAGAIDTLKIRVRNLGSNLLNAFNLNYSIGSGSMRTYSWNGSLAVSDAIDLVIDTFAFIPSDFTINVSAALAGDGDGTNDSLSMSLFGIPILSLPFSDTFESERNFYTLNTSEWQWGVPASTMINAASSGTKCWKTQLSRDYSNLDDAYLYSPLFDLSKAYRPVLSFHHWYNTESQEDGGRVEVSKDGGLTWKKVGVKGDVLSTNWYTNNFIFASMKPGWSGTSLGWIRSSYRLDSLQAYSGGLVQFRFNFASNDSVTANGWAIDDFSLDCLPAYSIAPCSVSGIQDPFTATVPEQLGAYFRNSGYFPVQDFSASLWSGSVLLGNDSVHLASPVAAGDSAYFTFSNPWFPSPGLNQLHITSSWPQGNSDGKSNDDTLFFRGGVFDSVSVSGSAHWCDDFEGGMSPWLTMGVPANDFYSSSWLEGTPAKVGMNGNFNGTSSWNTGILGNYPARDASALFTPVFALDSNTCYELSFAHRFLTEKFSDGGTVEYTTDQGSTWTVLGNYGDPAWYNSTYIAGLNNPPVPGFSGQNSNWQLAANRVRFIHPVNVVFRFRFGSDASHEDEGWEIDQVCLQKLPSCAIGITEEEDPEEITFIPIPPQEPFMLNGIQEEARTDNGSRLKIWKDEN